ncbi:hypothetical protein BRADI_2g19402v3, partial [Brachypodium distachyon]
MDQFSCLAVSAWGTLMCALLGSCYVGQVGGGRRLRGRRRGGRGRGGGGGVGGASRAAAGERRRAAPPTGAQEAARQAGGCGTAATADGRAGGGAAGGRLRDGGGRRRGSRDCGRLRRRLQDNVDQPTACLGEGEQIRTGKKRQRTEKERHNRGWSPGQEPISAVVATLTVWRHALAPWRGAVQNELRGGGRDHGAAPRRRTEGAAAGPPGPPLRWASMGEQGPWWPEIEQRKRHRQRRASVPAMGDRDAAAVWGTFPLGVGKGKSPSAGWECGPSVNVLALLASGGPSEMARALLQLCVRAGPDSSERNVEL